MSERIVSGDVIDVVHRIGWGGGVRVCYIMQAFRYTDQRTCRARARRTLATPESDP